MSTTGQRLAKLDKLALALEARQDFTGAERVHEQWRKLAAEQYATTWPEPDFDIEPGDVSEE